MNVAVGTTLQQRPARRGASAPAFKMQDRGVPPTPQTLRKLKRDVVRDLVHKGRLRRIHQSAAEEIGEVWQALGRGLFPVSGLGKKRQTDTRGEALDPFDRMSEREERVWRTRYKPWANNPAQAKPAGSTTRHGVVIDISAHNVGLRACERRYGFTNGTAIVHLRESLHDYCVTAGWLDE